MYYNIRLGMLRDGITIDEVARLLRVHRNTVSKKLNGKAKLSIDELELIKENFFPDLSLDKLAERTKRNA